MTLEELFTSHCQPRQSGKDDIDTGTRDQLLSLVPQWETIDQGKAITRKVSFKDFHHTLGFINAVGYLANHEDHHPDIEASYGYCRLRWSTHDVNGLSLNDFICAAKVDALLD